MSTATLTNPRFAAAPPPVSDQEAAETCKALDLADIADADLKAELDRLRAEVSRLQSKTSRDDNFRSRLRQLRDEEETLKTRCAEKRAAIKECVDEWLKGWTPSLFDSQASPESIGHAEPAVQPDDSWRQLPCGALQEVPNDPLSASMVVKLADNEVSTLGQLSDRMNAATEKGGQWWDNFAGVGPGRAEQIEKAFVAFWEANPKYTRAKVEEIAGRIGMGGATAPQAETEAAANGDEKAAEDDDEGDEE